MTIADLAPRNPWEVDLIREELVSIDVGASEPQQLFLSVRGPPRTHANQPVVLIECGAGATSRWWVVVQRLLSRHVRVYCYDRAGLGRSGPALVFPRTARTMASELATLLATVEVTPPLVLVAHSYGAIVAREYLARLAQPAQAVRGMVFVDANQEKTHDLLFTPSHIQNAIGKLSPLVIIGLDEGHRYSQEELEAIMREESGKGTYSTHAGAQEATGTASAADSEMANMRACGRALADRAQLRGSLLGVNPVTVIRGDAARDLCRIYEVALTSVLSTAQGREETEAHLARFAATDKKLQLEILQLSHTARFVQAKKSGHHIEATEPELIAREVSRVMSLVNRDEGR
ncbi:hypothetical protein PDE_02132 [Penicillium oxalicum 114-2]|uniref:AB hydrolase-1 domain-containing protein n=1 Tax=Penicillium oxalicum (strain 114-2 / CGMCC 5302) TaxID=933388 RepID=S7ZAE5_PENO1|nr:hypothetical protein PDE_02132 [Penicillium oxalicum 114-2]